MERVPLEFGRFCISLAKHGKQGYGGPFAFAEAGRVTHASVKSSSALTHAVYRGSRVVTSEVALIRRATF